MRPADLARVEVQERVLGAIDKAVRGSEGDISEKRLTHKKEEGRFK